MTTVIEMLGMTQGEADIVVLFVTGELNKKQRVREAIDHTKDAIQGWTPAQSFLAGFIFGHFIAEYQQRQKLYIPSLGDFLNAS